MKSAS
jgi:hypothetical protein